MIAHHAEGQHLDLMKPRHRSHHAHEELLRRRLEHEPPVHDSGDDMVNPRLGVGISENARLGHEFGNGRRAGAGVAAGQQTVNGFLLQEVCPLVFSCFLVLSFSVLASRFEHGTCGDWVKARWPERLVVEKGSSERRKFNPVAK